MSDTAITILVVDDEEAIRNLVQLLLEREGYRVLSASHSDDALLLLDGYPETVHLLLTDVKMDPFMDGCELAKCIRLIRPEIKVLYISGFVENSMVMQEVESGRAGFLAKPFSFPEFLDKVRTVIEGIRHPA